jgi:hypothetical protein
MAIILGVKQSVRTYQILQEKNNFSYINSSNSSNLLYLNVDENTHNNAVIRFKNNYEIGYIDNNISIFNKSNLITINNDNINLYKNTYLHCNLNVINYLYTLNNTTYFNNNIKLNLNNNINNSFTINNNNQPPIFEVSKNITNIRSPDLNIYSSNIRLSSNSILYTNFIDSPNEKPVVIRNMAFAESLRIFTANIVQNISLDNNILFTDLFSDRTEAINPYGILTDEEWTQYMTNNNININDTLFIKPNINVTKFIGANNNVGGSNILEFNVIPSNSPNSNLIFSINNKGFISIGSNYNLDIPLKINIAPENSNIIQYTNINDSNKCYSINSNGYMNIGSIDFSPNQINIYKNDNYDRNNTDLISLNINNINNTSNDNLIDIIFNNNNSYTDFIFDSTINNTKRNININITNYFIINNIIPIVNLLYYESSFYNVRFNFNDVNNYNVSINYSIRYPKNGINIQYISGIDNIIKYIIYPSQFQSPPSSDNIDISPLFNKIVINETIFDNSKATFIFYIYIDTYIYSYTGKYYPKLCNYLTAKTNDLTFLNISQKGNIGIGTTYSDLYKLYINDNALINNINCKTIDNYLTKNISMCNCILNDIDTINNVKLIKSDYLISSNNFLSNLINIHTTINSNLTILSSTNGKFIVNTKSIFGSNINPYENYLVTINCCNIIDGLAIKNDIINNNPNLLIYSSCATSYPYIKLQSPINSYNIEITSNNNFQIKNINSNVSIIENNSINNSISLFNNSFNIFKDSSGNIKFYAGINPDYQYWYDHISEIGTNTQYKSSFNIYGDFNVYSSTSLPIISCKKSLNNSFINICIGIENTEVHFSTNNLLINYNTTFNSNISVLNNIYLKGTILSISDCNLKTNITKIENPLDKIETISGYTYKRKDTGNLETGLIAQEVIKILPEVINYNTDSNYTISYGNMAGILVECIKELNEKIKLLNNRIEKLE